MKIKLKEYILNNFNINNLKPKRGIFCLNIKTGKIFYCNTMKEAASNFNVSIKEIFKTCPRMSLGGYVYGRNLFNLINGEYIFFRLNCLGHLGSGIGDLNLKQSIDYLNSIENKINGIIMEQRKNI